MQDPNNLDIAFNRSVEDEMMGKAPERTEVKTPAENTMNISVHAAGVRPKFS